VGIFLLYGYIMFYTDETVKRTLYGLSLPKESEWMFLVVELISMYVGIVVLWRLVLQRSVLRKRHLAGIIPADLSYKDSVRDTLCFRFFWIESLLILLPATYWTPVRENVCDMIGYKTDLVILQYIVSFFLFVLPMLLLFCHTEAQLRRLWAEEWYHLDEGQLRRFREGVVNEKKYYVKLVINILLYWFGMLLLPAGMTYLLAALNALSVFLVILPQVIAVLVTALVLWFLTRLWRSYRRRKKFIREIKEVCDKHKYKFTYRFSFKSLLVCTGKTEFTVTTDKKTFVGCLLPVPGKISRLYFSPHEDSYRFEVFTFNVYFPKHKLDFAGLRAQKEDSEKVVVLTRRPSIWRLGNRKGGVTLDNGSVLGGQKGKVTVYDIAGFVSTLDMAGIRRHRDIWQ